MSYALEDEWDFQTQEGQEVQAERSSVQRCSVQLRVAGQGGMGEGPSKRGHPGLCRKEVLKAAEGGV